MTNQEPKAEGKKLHGQCACVPMPPDFKCRCECHNEQPEPTKADKLVYLYEKIGFPFSLCTTLNRIWQHTNTYEAGKNQDKIVEMWDFEEESLKKQSDELIDFIYSLLNYEPK